MKRKIIIALGSGMVAYLALAYMFMWTPVVKQARTRSLAIYQCRDNLRYLDGATQLWAKKNGKNTNAAVTLDEIAPFLKDVPFYHGEGFPVCPQGGKYTVTTAGEAPTCSLGSPKRIRRGLFEWEAPGHAHMIE